MGFFDKDFEEIFSSQTMSIIGGLIGGTLLAVFTDQILIIPGILVLLPGLLEMRGSISGSFACRLSSGLFLGAVKPDKYKTRIVRGNMIATFLLVILLSFAIGFVAFVFNYLVLGVVMTEIIILPVIAGIISNLIQIPATLFVTFYLFRKGHDPNNIIGPFVTSTGDVITIVSLLISIVIV
jgi:mgtE-like transporter